MHLSHSSVHRDTPEIVLKSIFQRYDTDEDGKLNESEFQNALSDLGIIDETEQKALFALADSDNDTYISYTHFFKLVKKNNLDFILSSKDDYDFVIETYKLFEQYDENGDGKVSWSEFYHYLTKHGYSHHQISHYWYYMEPKSDATISFGAFWKGYKFQKQSFKIYEQQNEINKGIEERKTTKPKEKFSKTFNRPSLLQLIDDNSWNQEDPNNIFSYMKEHLSPISKQHCTDRDL